MIEPKLRFKKDDGSDFPDWEEKKLGDVCDTLTYGMNAAAVKFDGENKYIRITDIDDESHCYKNDELVSPDGELDNKYLVCENDILLARTGASVGKSYLYNKEDGKLYYAGFLIKAHVKSENSKFIFFQTLTERYDKWVKITSMRSGQPGINANEYSDFTMNVPSLPEQQKIADFLSTIDTIIEKQRATVSAWEERKKGVMQKLFSQEVRFKADGGSDFPDWEEKKINDIATCFAGATPSTKIPEYWEDGTIQWMSSGEVNNGQIFETEKRISKLGFDKCSTKMVKPNTVVIALAGQGKTRGMVAITRISLCTNQSLCAIETNTDICDDYLYQYLQLQYNNLRLISSGDGTRGGLNLKLIGNYSVSIPSLSEQQKIADCLSALDTVIEKQKETLEKWQELKKGLLQQMFV